MAALILILFVSTAVLYLNQVGLPDSLRLRIEAGLLLRGVDLQFRSVRLSGFRTFVMENLEWKGAGNAGQIHAAMREGELRLSLIDLFVLEFVPESLTIREGTIGVPFAQTGGISRDLSMNSISSVIRFLPKDRWELSDFQATALNAKIRLSGTIDHASEIGRSKSDRESRAKPTRWQERIDEWATRFRGYEFTVPADLSIDFRGDALNWGSSEADLEIQAPGVTASWGSLGDIRGNARISPDVESNAIKIAANLRCKHASAELGEFTEMEFRADLNYAPADARMNRGDWSLELADVNGNAVKARNIRASGTTSRSSNGAFLAVTQVNARASSIHAGPVEFADGRIEAEVFHSRTNSAAITGDWQLVANRLTSELGTADRLSVGGRVGATGVDPVQPQNRPRDFRDLFNRAHLNWTGEMEGLRTSEVVIGDVEVTGDWTAPNLMFDLVHVDETGRKIAVSTHLDSGTLGIQSEIASNFDPHRITSLLTPNTQRWVRQFTWTEPPIISARVQWALPSRERNTRFGRETAAQGLKLDGTFKLGHGTFRGASFTAAQSDFGFSNRNWHFPNLIVARPEGESKLDYRVNAITKDYSWTVNARVLPHELIEMLDETDRAAFEFFEFSQALHFEGTIRGRWQERERLNGEARISISDFSFRDEKCDALSASIAFQHPLLTLKDVSVRRGNAEITAGHAEVNLIERMLTVTNTVSTVDASVLTRWIGPKVHRLLEPYSFLDPPRVVVNGRLPLGKKDGADVRFQISGRSFNYWRFNLAEFSADLNWREQSLSITNLNAGFYEGRLNWGGEFDFSIAEEGAAFQFQGIVADANLQTLTQDLTLTNSELKGLLNGRLIVTSARSADWKSWHGYGEAAVRDGALWSIPIVGVFSPIVNKLTPGLGSSQASAASATFRIEKSVIRTSDMEVRAPALRLRYNGSVDFDGNVNATMRAEILRDMWAVGRMVTIAFWPLTKAIEYRVTGSLQEPKSVPRFVPRILLLPFQPLKTLQEILSPDRAPSILTPLPDPKSNGSSVNSPKN